MDHPVAGIEKEQDGAWILTNLIAVPHERLSWSTWGASCEWLDIFRLDRIVQVFQKLLLFGARPGLERDLAIRRIGDAARSALIARFEPPGILTAVPGRRFIIASERSLRICQVIVIANGVGPVAGDVRLPVGETRAGPFTLWRRDERCLPPATQILSRGDKRYNDDRAEEESKVSSHNCLIYFVDGTG